MAFNIPAKQRACIYDAPGQLSTRVVELDVPEPGLGEVLVRLSHSGICHSDYGVMTNSWQILPEPTPAGQVGGHEGVGIIVKIGRETEPSPVKLGQRVGIKWISGVCRSCAACNAGYDNLCVNQKVSGYFTPGTFQEYVCSPADYVTPIPDGLDSAAAAPLLCAGVTVYSALLKAGCRRGDWIVILGAGGGLGHIAVQIAAHGMGFKVIGVDHPSKRELIESSGAEVFADYTSVKDMTLHVKGLTEGLGAHAVLVLTASNAAYASALPMLRFKGTLVCVGIPEGTMQTIPNAFPGWIMELEQRIVGSSVGTQQEAKEVLEMAARGIVKTHFKTCALDQISGVFEQMEKGQIQGRVVAEIIPSQT